MQCCNFLYPTDLRSYGNLKKIYFSFGYNCHFVATETRKYSTTSSYFMTYKRANVHFRAETLSASREQKSIFGDYFFILENNLDIVRVVGLYLLSMFHGPRVFLHPLDYISLHQKMYHVHCITFCQMPTLWACWTRLCKGQM